MTVCRRVYYSGRVQGVGFRATARTLARQAGVTGYVRNLPDRRVELVAEGTADNVERYLASVSRAMDGYITDADVQDETPQGYTAFTIER